MADVVKPGDGGTPKVVTPVVKTEPNPWAEFGLNADGTPLEVPKVDDTPPDPKALAAENVTLREKIGALETKLGKLPSGFEGMQKKLELLDRFAKSIAGGGDDSNTDAEAAKAVYADFKKIVSPGTKKLLDMLDRDPDYLDKLTNATGSLYASQLSALNVSAHAHVKELAKKAGFKGTDAEIDELVLPFEHTMTGMINSSPELLQAFLGGNQKVVDDLFTRLIRPHVAARLRGKKELSNVTTVKAPPKSGGTPSTGKEGEPGKPDIKTPQGRAAFHKAAVGRWLDKRQAASEE